MARRRSPSRNRAATIAYSLIALLFWARLLPAQAGPPRADSSRTDTLRRKSADSPLFYVLAIAPASWVLLADSTDTTTVAGGPLAWHDVNVSAYVSTGAGTADTIANSTYAANLELSVRSVFASARFERLENPYHLRYLTLRAGRMAFRARMFAGGVTLGYRDAHGRGAHHGVEMAFPLIIGGRRWRMRFETAYLVGNGAYYNYRFQVDWWLRRGPLFFGLDVDAKDLPLRSGAQIGPGSVALMLGVRR